MTMVPVTQIPKELEEAWWNATTIVRMRQSEDSLLKQAMIEVKNRYNGDFIVPLSDVEGNPVMEPPVPALIADAIDGLSMQASSTSPICAVPALIPHDQASVDRSVRRRKAYYATWHDSRMKLLWRRAYRHLGGYGLFAMVGMPDDKTQRPKLSLRDPLTAYPDETSPEEIRMPLNVGFVVGRSAAWVRHYFPEASDIVGGQREDQTWDLCEWIDEQKIMVGLLGPRFRNETWTERMQDQALLLRAWENRAGCVPVICPGRVTLDRIAGQVSKIVGIVDLLGRLTALDVIAAEKAVFPDRYLVGRDGHAPVIVGGRWKDGRTGETNILQHVDKIGAMTEGTGPDTQRTISYLERAGRMSGGTPGIFGGELTGAIRSGQTIGAAAAYAVDPRVQEVQEIMEVALTQMNEAINGIYTGYWPNKKYTIFSGWPGDFGHVEFTPSEDLAESRENVVTYPFPGADMNAITVMVGQARGAGIMSLRTAINKHPAVEDPDEEMLNLDLEALTDAAKAAVFNRAANGELPEVDVIRMLELRTEGKSLIEAFKQAQEEAQQRQAREAQPQVDPATGMPMGGVPPAAMPGMANPGAGAEEMMPPPDIPPPDQDIQNFRQVLNSLGAGRDALRQENEVIA